MTELDFSADLATLTQQICDISSVSGEEEPLADAVWDALSAMAHLEVLRDGNTIVARTTFGHEQRVVLAGHLDTVPIGTKPDGSPTLPTWWVDGDTGRELWGRGTCDMKGGVAVQLALAARLTEPNRDVTYVFYDCEEVEATRNGLLRVVRNHPDWVAGDFAVLGEPTCSKVEGGCNGTIRVEVTVEGVSSHSARNWMGVNAIQKVAPLLTKLDEYQASTVDVDGLAYRESLSAVGIRGGIAGNVIPDECVLTVNYRFAPSMSIDEAEAFLRDFFEGYQVVVTDAASGARPGLSHPAAADFVAVSGQEPLPKLGWTDVSLFTELGIPAINFGPANPLVAHKDDEHVAVHEIESAYEVLSRWLS